MESEKKRRLDVFKAITRDLSPEFSENTPNRLPKATLTIPYPTGQFSFFNSVEVSKARYSPVARSESAESCNRVSIPSEIFTNYPRKFESFGQVLTQEHTAAYVYVLYASTEAAAKANHFLQSFDLAESSCYDSSSEYVRNFSNNSPMLNISTEESSREEKEERRKPKKRPLDEGEKTFYVININAIRKGSDTRTTVMIKNIPNKYTQKMLLQTIDKKYMGTYDFLYLPIDFKVSFM